MNPSRNPRPTADSRCSRSPSALASSRRSGRKVRYASTGSSPSPCMGGKADRCSPEACGGHDGWPSGGRPNGVIKLAADFAAEGNSQLLKLGPVGFWRSAMDCVPAVPMPSVEWSGVSARYGSSETSPNPWAGGNADLSSLRACGGHGGTLSQAKPNGLIEFAGGLAAEAKSQSLKLGPLTPARSDAGHALVAAGLGSSTLPQESEGPVSRPSIVCD